MLESLGYAEASARDGADLILFNTCSIREKADTRLEGHLGEAKRLKARAPGPGDRRGRLLVAVDEGAGVRAVPVRGRGLRSRPGAQAGRVPDQRQPDRPGLLRVRGLHRAPADAPRARLPGLDADLGRLQLQVRLLHRALHPRARGLAARPRARGRGRAAGRRRGARDHAAGPERELLRPRPARRAPRPPSPSCWPWSTRSRASTGSATPARTPRTCARTWWPPTWSSSRCASTSTCRCRPARRGCSRPCAARTTASATWTGWR